MATDLTVIILTFNEERNIAQALTSVCGWASQVYVLDSFSADRTREIAAGFECQFFQHRFEGYAAQRNYALTELPITTGWVLFLDADEWVPADLAQEITGILAAKPAADGFLMRRRFMWMGRWIRRGYYSTRLLRLFRTGKGYCEPRKVNEHIVVEGPLAYLRGALIHESHNGVGEWIEKHNRYAALEACEMLAAHADGQFPSGQAGTKRWIASHFWNRLPLVWRATVYFVWRYLFLGGFLDGWQGFSFHVIQALWLWVVIDLKYLEMSSAHGSTQSLDELAVESRTRESSAVSQPATGPLDT